MDKQDIGQMFIVPPRLDVVQIRPIGIAFAFPGKPAMCDPLAPDLAQIGWTGWQGWSHTTGCLIEASQACVTQVAVVVENGQKAAPLSHMAMTRRSARDGAGA